MFTSCLRWKVNISISLMGQLPVIRMTQNVKPFTYTGVNYLGLVTVTVGRRSENHFGVIITCGSGSSIHLEVSHSLTTELTILVIKDMIPRRGPIKETY